MKIVSFALVLGIVGCMVGQSAAAADAVKLKEKIVYSFGSSSTDGAGPRANLIDVKGTLYGTTYAGGNANCAYGSTCGTVFSLDPRTGSETVLYAFCGQQNCTDGAEPTAGLTEVNGVLYGTTYSGGGGSATCTGGCGTAFSLDPKTGTETVLHSFCSQQGCADGASPLGGLTEVNGVLYGTTYSGGAQDSGTIYVLDPSTGVETVVYSFIYANGVNPYASMIDVNGTLYGTTEYGGADAGGTVFSIHPTAGTEKVVYSFCQQANCTDGAYPVASLIDVKGILYGTTSGGGGNCTEYGGCGTVFAVDPDTGAETVLYSFCRQQGCSDGELPEASLIGVKGILYGTTPAGDYADGGTVFAVNPKTRVETVIYSFSGGEDGIEPEAGLIDAKGALYGTTYYGGANCGNQGGCGTVFVLRH